MLQWPDAVLSWSASCHVWALGKRRHWNCLLRTVSEIKPFLTSHCFQSYNPIQGTRTCRWHCAVPESTSHIKQTIVKQSTNLRLLWVLVVLPSSNFIWYIILLNCANLAPFPPSKQQTSSHPKASPWRMTCTNLASRRCNEEVGCNDIPMVKRNKNKVNQPNPSIFWYPFQPANRSYRIDCSIYIAHSSETGNIAAELLWGVKCVLQGYQKERRHWNLISNLYNFVWYVFRPILFFSSIQQHGKP